MRVKRNVTVQIKYCSMQKRQIARTENFHREKSPVLFLSLFFYPVGDPLQQKSPGTKAWSDLFFFFFPSLFLPLFIFPFMNLDVSSPSLVRVDLSLCLNEMRS